MRPNFTFSIFPFLFTHHFLVICVLCTIIYILVPNYESIKQFLLTSITIIVPFCRRKCALSSVQNVLSKYKPAKNHWNLHLSFIATASIVVFTYPLLLLHVIQSPDREPSVIGLLSYSTAGCVYLAAQTTISPTWQIYLPAHYFDVLFSTRPCGNTSFYEQYYLIFIIYGSTSIDALRGGLLHDLLLSSSTLKFSRSYHSFFIFVPPFTVLLCYNFKIYYLRYCQQLPITISLDLDYHAPTRTISTCVFYTSILFIDLGLKQ